jgi:hypothetical protein
LCKNNQTAMTFFYFFSKEIEERKNIQFSYKSRTQNTIIFFFF